jgi:hypothetical protein
VIAVPGYWKYEGGDYLETSPEGRKVFSLSCVTGVTAKCILRGYVPFPWSQDPREDDLYRACLHASRAEFSKGNQKQSISYTCNGTIIDISDHLKIQTWDTFEAAWGKDGILCMNHSRYTGCEEELKNTPPCQQEMAREDYWPEGVLIKTRSANNKARGGKCPSDANLCH